MPKRFLLLTGRFEAQILLPQLQRASTGVVHVETRDQLERELSVGTEDTRLLAFCTAVIVPAAWLEKLPGPSYNIHPGPPDYPGRHPESWGAYDGRRRFGATLHEMAPRVDEGAIVDVEWVDVPEGSGQMTYGMRAFRASMALLSRWTHGLVHGEAPLPVSDHRWSGRKTTHAQLLAMCRVTTEIGWAEFERRRRAFAEAAGSRITLVLHGREFVHTTPGPVPEPVSPVTIGEG